MKHRTIFLLSIIALACQEETSKIVVEAFSPATRGGSLQEFVGVGLGESEFAPVMEPPCPLPCEVTASFSTEFDEQEEIQIELYRGYTSNTGDAHYLGTYLVTGLPAVPAGEPDVVVTFRADNDGLSLIATETSGIPLSLERAD